MYTMDEYRSTVEVVGARVVNASRSPLSLIAGRSLQQMPCEIRRAN
jgi:hypothetical protein